MQHETALRAVRPHLRDQLLLYACHRPIVRPRLLLLHARTPTAWVQWRRPPCGTAHLLRQVLLRLPVRLLQVRRGERRLLRLRSKLRLVRREVRLLLLLLRLLLLRLLLVLLRRQRCLLRLVLRVAVVLRCLRILVRVALLRGHRVGCGAPLGPCRPGRLARSRLRMPRLAHRLLTVAWPRRLLRSALRLGLRSSRRALARLQLLAKAVQALRDLHNVVILPARTARLLSTSDPCKQHWRVQQGALLGPKRPDHIHALVRCAKTQADQAPRVDNGGARSGRC